MEWNSGTRNVLALQDLLSRQEVAYDFQFYTTQFNADIPVIVFSEKKSLLNVSLCSQDFILFLSNLFGSAMQEFHSNVMLTRWELSRIRLRLPICIWRGRRLSPESELSCLLPSWQTTKSPKKCKRCEFSSNLYLAFPNNKYLLCLSIAESAGRLRRNEATG